MTESYFENIENVIINEIMLARKSIKIAVAWFNLKTILDILTIKVRGGISVEIILQDDEINNGGKYSLNFRNYKNHGGLVIWARSENSTMHQKFCIIDDETVITGSFNWTNRAEKRNDEDILVHKNDNKIAANYVGRFDELKTKYSSSSAIISKRTENTKRESSRNSLPAKSIIDAEDTYRKSSINIIHSNPNNNGEIVGSVINEYVEPFSKNYYYWKPRPVSEGRIQPIPDSEFIKKFPCHNKNGQIKVCSGLDVRYYHTDKFYSRLEDIPDTFTACDLISVSPFANKFIYLSIKDPSIKTIAELRKSSGSKRKTVNDNPDDFEFSKYGVIYREDPKCRKIIKYKGFPIETIIEIVKWIYEDYKIPISANYYERLSGLIDYVDHLDRCEKELFYSLFSIENYEVHFKDYYATYRSIDDFGGNCLTRTINDIYFQGYNAYKHKIEWQQHPELITLGDYIKFLKHDVKYER